MSAFVYILASKPNGTLYTGSTTDLVKRIHEHKNKLIAGFTKQYSVTQLVYYEVHDDISDAGWRERCLKKWSRRDKIKLIAKDNPEWRDLYDEILTGEIRFNSTAFLH